MRKITAFNVLGIFLSLAPFSVQASVYFLPSGKDRLEFDLDFNLSSACANMGYSVKASSCSSGSTGNPCPHSSDYVDKCLTPDEWCRENGYSVKAENCAKPSYPSGNCSKSSGYFKECVRDEQKACGEEGYYLTCNTGQVPDTSSSGCPYNSAYKKCVCNPCSGYEYTLAEAGAQGYRPGPECNSCGTVKYMRLPADCGNYVECDCGGVGTACWSGTKKLFASCQSCCENRCTIADSARQTGVLYEYEDCSGKYCDIGCATGYTDWCVKPETDCAKLGYTQTASQCPNGYLKCPYGLTAVFCKDESLGTSSDADEGFCLAGHKEHTCSGKTYCCPDTTLTDCSEIRMKCYTTDDEDQEAMY